MTSEHTGRAFARRHRIGRNALTDPLGRAGSASHMSMQQKNAAVRPLVRSATECVARTVSSDPRFGVQLESDDINDLIVESMPSCVDPDAPMIDAYDRLFGMGTGESFFAGPYLDVLPAAVHKLLERGADNGDAAHKKSASRLRGMDRPAHGCSVAAAPDSSVISDG